MILTLPYPAIDPVAVEIGPVVIRWYALAYIAGLFLGWRYCRRLVQRPPRLVTTTQVDDFLFWATLAVILGGRLGYVLFYQPEYFLSNPLQIFALWRGGMSFHGGLLGVVAALVLFARRRGLPLMALADPVCAAVPIGLFFGRLANFINGELFGRPADVPWAMVFPGGGPVPRHPSQLYEAGLEGVVLFLVLWGLVVRARALEKPGLVSGAFLAGYGAARIAAEFFRAPDLQIGYLAGAFTMGQLLSLPVLAAGAWLVTRAVQRSA